MVLSVSPGVYFGLLAALVSAIFFGAGDWGSGELAKKTSPVLFTISIWIVEIPVLFVLFLASGDYGKTSTNISMFLFGIIGMFSFFLLVYALTKGHVSVVMALAGLLALIVPAIASIVIGETTSMLVWIGIIIAGVAIVCITQAREAQSHEDEITHLKGLKISIILGCVVGILTGAYFTGLSQFDSPIIAKLFFLQSSGLIFGLVYFAVKKPGFVVLKNNFFIIVAIAIAYNAGQFLFPFSSTKTSLVVTNIIVNLYPGVTIGLAKLFSHEKTSRTQNVGFAIAVLGVVVVSIGASS